MRESKPAMRMVGAWITGMLAACSGGSSPTTSSDASDEAPDARDASESPVDAPAITGSALQVNDVSILWPLPATREERDTALLAATSAGPRGPLVPETVYTAAGGMLAFGGNVAHEDLRVVALRLDPCFAQLAPPLDGAGCEPQLRLILQPISATPGPSGTLEAGDAAVHSFHRITRAEAFALAAALVELRLASTAGEALGPLAPHPVIRQQGLAGAYATGVRQLVLAHAGASNLVRVAILSSPTTQAWSFRIFDVLDASAGTVQPQEIAALPSSTQRHDVVAFGGGGLFIGFTPEPTGPLAFNELAASNRAAELTSAARQLQFDGLLGVENPRLSTPETVSCGACHVATLVRARIAEAEYGLQAASSPNVFVPDDRFVVPGDVSPTLGALGGFNLHAFSYNGSEPSITSRTANETAAVVAYLNLASP